MKRPPSKSIKNPSPLHKPLVHFVGVGGIGMSSLARWFLAENWSVSGSDIVSSTLTNELKKEGLNVKIGHTAANVPKDASLVIYSQAIRPDNPELRAATARKMIVLPYPHEVGRLTRTYNTIAIAGAHGKSTTTAMIALILEKAGLDPTVIIGTKLREFKNKNFRMGKGPYLVLEADEYKNSFLHYSPVFTVLTTIDAEHLDVFKNIAGVKAAFLKFLSRTLPGGLIVLNKDDTHIHSLKSAIAKTLRKTHRVMWYSLKSPDARAIRKVIQIPGEHNISNALAALTLARALGVKDNVSLKALGAFKGSWRRMEYRGKIMKGALVFDDYGHHPTEIKATLRGLKEKYPGKKILCVFQPHQAERLKMLFKEFQGAFHDADETLILPIYKVPGRDEPKPKLTSDHLVRSIQEKYPKKPLFYLANPKDLKKAITALSVHSPLSQKVIIMMGAGNIVDYTKDLLR